jgi:hypothetical protein
MFQPVFNGTSVHTVAVCWKGSHLWLLVREHCREPCRLTDELRSMILTDTLRPDTVRLADDSRTRSVLSAQEDRERSRALNGLILRQKVYALGDYDSAH